MAEIDYGKGIRGFLSQVPDIDYQYSPMPFNEMLGMAQLAGQKEATNMKLMGEVNKMYNQPMLPKDKDIFDQKAEAFNKQVGALVDQTGGNLSHRNMSRTLMQNYYDIVNDRDYINAVNSYSAHQKFQTKVQSAVKDPDLRGYYMQQSLGAYNESEPGSVYSPYLQFSSMSETEFDSNLNSVADDLKARKIQELRQDGNLQQTVQSVTLEPNDIYSALIDHYKANNNLMQYGQDKSNATGVDIQTFLNNKFATIANRYAQGDISEGKLTEIPGLSDRTAKPKLPGAVVGLDIKSALGNYENLGERLISLDQLSNKDASAVESMYNIIAEREGVTPAQLKKLKEGETNDIYGEISRLQEQIVQRDGVYAFEGSVDEKFIPGGNPINLKVQENSRKAVEAAIQLELMEGVKSGQYKAIIPKDQLTSEKMRAGVERYMEEFADNKQIIYSDYAGKTGKIKQVMDGLGINLQGVLKGQFTPITDVADVDKAMAGFKPTAISSRMYWNYETGQPFVYVSGMTGEKGKEENMLGKVDARNLLGVNSDLNSIDKSQEAFYYSPTAVDLSRLQFPGQSVVAEPKNAAEGTQSFDNFAKEYIKEEVNPKLGSDLNTDNFSVGVQFANGKYFIRLYSLKDSRPVQTIISKDGFASMNDVSIYMDDYIEELERERAKSKK
ncbi:MAG TPA: hypothetical protein DCX01_04435 [Bacteroidetes bacterium]|nr:hypothetical protein [Bacteroidota bacterium]